MKYLLALTLSFLAIEAYGKLSISTYNIRNFDYDERSRVRTNKDHLFTTLQNMNADFIGVQEINKTEVFSDFIKRRFNGKYDTALSTCGGAHDQRLGFVFDTNKFKLLSFTEDLRVSNPHSPNQGFCNSGSRPLAVGKFKVQETGKVFIAISVHLKSGGRDSSIKKRFKQLELIGEAIAEFKEQGVQNFVVMGDFNSTEYIRKGQTRNRFEKAVRDMGLYDVTASLSCTAYWWGGRSDGREYPSQLDHILVSGNFYSNVKSANEKPSASTKLYGHCARLNCAVTAQDSMGVSYDQVSDHCPIVSELK